MPYLMGLDISTTGAKALIIDEAGAVFASANTPLPISQPKPLWSEQNPSDWWEGISASIRRALADSGLRGDDISAIGLTGQMHGLVLLDANGAVLAAVDSMERPAHTGAMRLYDRSHRRRSPA